MKEGISRINVKLKSIDGTEINGMGPDIGRDKVAELMEKLKVLGQGDVIVLAGSIPTAMPDDIYSWILEQLEGRGVTSVVDATGDLLLNVLKYHPFLIKPNSHELGDIFGVKLKAREDVVPYAKKLQEMGARNVLVSMAGEGAVLAAEDGSVYDAPAPKGVLVNVRYGGLKKDLSLGLLQSNRKNDGWTSDETPREVSVSERFTLYTNSSYGIGGGYFPRPIGQTGYNFKISGYNTIMPPESATSSNISDRYKCNYYFRYYIL